MAGYGKTFKVGELVYISTHTPLIYGDPRSHREYIAGPFQIIEIKPSGHMIKSVGHPQLIRIEGFDNKGWISGQCLCPAPMKWSYYHRYRKWLRKWHVRNNIKHYKRLGFERQEAWAELCAQKWLHYDDLLWRDGAKIQWYSEDDPDLDAKFCDEEAYYGQYIGGDHMRDLDKANDSDYTNSMSNDRRIDEEIAYSDEDRRAYYDSLPLRRVDHPSLTPAENFHNTILGDKLTAALQK